MNTVADILEDKGYDIASIGPGETVFRAIEEMAARGIGALLVIEKSKLLGVISERDYARKIVLQGKGSKQTLVRDIMTTDLTCVKPDTPVEECMAIMTEKRVRHLPVLEDNELVGVASIGDVVKQIIADKDFTILQLEGYICHG